MFHYLESRRTEQGNTVFIKVHLEEIVLNSTGKESLSIQWETGMTVISAAMLSVLHIHIHTAGILANLLLEKKVAWISLCANMT